MVGAFELDTCPFLVRYTRKQYLLPPGRFRNETLLIIIGLPI